MDAISSAIGPAVVETAKGATKTQVSNAVAAAVTLPQSTGATTARERNNMRRLNGDLEVENIGTSSRGAHRLDPEKQRAHGGRPLFKYPRRGGSTNAPVRHTETGEGGDGGPDDALVWDGFEFAEARRKMLDPPKVAPALF